MAEDRSGNDLNTGYSREAEVEKILQEKHAKAVAASKKAQNKNLLMLCAMAVVLVCLVYMFIIMPIGKNQERESQYQRAIEYYEAGNEPAALFQFQGISGYKESLRYINKIELHVCQRIAANHGITVSSPSIFGVTAAGKVLVAGSESYYPKVPSWGNIIAIGAGSNFVVGLASDGKVFADGNNRYGACDVSTWSNITQIAVSPEHTVGLASDGRVYATGRNEHGECDVSAWTDVVYIAAGQNNTAGIKADGTLLLAGQAGKFSTYRSGYGSIAPSRFLTDKWQNLIKVYVSEYWIVGIQQDGTVLVSGGISEEKLNEKRTSISWAEAEKWPRFDKGYVRFWIKDTYDIYGITPDGFIDNSRASSGDTDLYKRGNHIKLSFTKKYRQDMGFENALALVGVGYGEAVLRTDGTVKLSQSYVDDYPEVSSWRLW